MQRLGDKFVGGVRQEMLGRGFTLVDTPRFFDEDLFLRLKRSNTVLRFHSKRWWTFRQLARYGCWLERQLTQALPEESLCLAALEFRREPAGFVDNEVDQLHADGSYIRSVYTLYGLPTIYREGRAELPVPAGQSLLMTAMDRARARRVPCTLHRRPGAGPARAVIVGSFEPRKDDPQLAAVYRQAAEQVQCPQRKRRACPGL
jgi:hypothetical protein